MKLVTYTHHNRARVGILEDDRVYRTTFDLDMTALIYRGVSPVRTRENYSLDEVHLNAPILPGKIICVGRNYAKHAEELGNEVPSAPLLFAKMPSSVIGPNDTITWRESTTKQVDWEGELGVIIKKEGRDIAEEDAMDYVYGYTVANDVSARDLQDSESQWLRAKGLDTFCPMGPVIVTKDEIDDPQNLTIKTTVNDKEMQNGNTSLMVYSVAALISYMSSTFTLMPGDLIMTGTPSGVGKGMKPPTFLKDGDRVSVSIDGIGTIKNPCKIEAEKS